jgi:hypothetical protein
MNAVQINNKLVCPTCNTGEIAVLTAVQKKKKNRQPAIGKEFTYTEKKLSADCYLNVHLQQKTATQCKLLVGSGTMENATGY